MNGVSESLPLMIFDLDGVLINSKDIQLIDKGLNSPFNMDFSGIYSLKEWLNN